MLVHSRMDSLPLASGSIKMEPTSKATLDLTSQKAKDSGHLQMVTKSKVSTLRPNAQMSKAMRSNFRGELQVTFLTEPVL